MPVALENTFLGRGKQPVARSFTDALKRVRQGVFAFSAAAGILLSSAAYADPIAYTAVDDELARLDLSNGQLFPIGEFGSISGTPFLDVEGMAFDSKGMLFGVSDLTETLMRLQIGSGEAQAVSGIYGLGLQNQGTGGDLNQLDFGLAFTCNGTLWLSSDSARKLWRVDPGEGSSTLIGETEAKISGLAAYGDRLFGIGVAEDEGLYEIDTETGLATLIGSLELGYNFYDAGLDFDADGNLWAVLDFNPPPAGQPQIERVSEIVRINVDTGIAGNPVRVQGDDSIEIESLAIAPAICPEGPSDPPIEVPTIGPSALALLMLLFASFGAVLIGRRR